ncbi:MAG: hypothetical protein KGL63_00950 [Betaproteobacteria bacterium]|nr:hypothetical protein [Betaproteobacteria bacterium]
MLYIASRTSPLISLGSKGVAKFFERLFFFSFAAFTINQSPLKLNRY